MIKHKATVNKGGNMSAEIWVALIMSLGSLIGVIVTVVWGNKKNAEATQKQTELTIYRIDQLEEKVNKHNNLIERMYELEQKEAVIEKTVQAVKEKVDFFHHS